MPAKPLHPLVACSLFAVLVCFQLYSIFHSPIWHDDATYGTVSKNLVLHKGYAFTVFDRFVRFDKGITAGPVLILPGVAMIALLGNAFWVPQVTGVLLTDFLLIVLFCQLSTVLTMSMARWQTAALFLLSAILITNHDIGAMGDKMHVWHAFMGDIPCALFIVLSVLYIARDRTASRRLFLGGLIAGLGVACKLQALIGVGTFAGCLALHSLACRQRYQLSVSRIAGNILLYSIGAALPLLLFETAKISLLGWQGYIAHSQEMAAVGKEIIGISTIAEFLKKADTLGEFLGILHIHITPSSSVFTNQIFWLFLILTMLLLLKAGSTAVQYLYRQLFTVSAPVQWASEILLCCCFAHLAWWLVVCNVIFPRYAIPGLMYGCAALALYIGARIETIPEQASRYAALLAVLIILLRLDAVAYLGKAPEHQDDLQEQQAVMRTLEGIQQHAPNTVIFSCGFAFEMEYLMPKSGNFIPCETMQDAAFAGHPKVLLSYSIDGTGKVLKQKPGSFWFEEQYNSDTVSKACPKADIFTSKHYRIATCNL